MPDFNPIGAAIAAAAEKHFNDAPLKWIDVPEWVVEGEPVRIFYRPMTMDERFDIASYKQETGDRRYQQVYAVIRRSLDKDGKRLFDLSHEITFLKHVDDGPVLRLADALIAFTTVADAKKGSETTPNA